MAEFYTMDDDQEAFGGDCGSHHSHENSTIRIEISFLTYIGQKKELLLLY